MIRKIIEIIVSFVKNIIIHSEIVRINLTIRYETSFIRGQELPKTREIGHECTNDDCRNASFVHWWQKFLERG
jgi:hypothetical protein